MCRTHFWQKKERIIIRNGGNTICLPNLFDRGVVHIIVTGDIVDHYFLMFDRGVVHIVVAVILLTITVSCLTEEWSILLWLAILLIVTVFGV